MTIDRAHGDDFEPILGPTLATVHRKWLDMGLPASTWPAFAARACECRPADLSEVRLSDCAAGCKVMACRCGRERVVHSATYGCAQSEAA